MRVAAAMHAATCTWLLQTDAYRVILRGSFTEFAHAEGSGAHPRRHEADIRELLTLTLTRLGLTVHAAATVAEARGMLGAHS